MIHGHFQKYQGFSHAQHCPKVLWISGNKKSSENSLILFQEVISLIFACSGQDIFDTNQWLA